MKGKTGSVAESLRPVLDTYLGSAVALVGCTSRDLARYSCEYDVLVVTNDRHPPTSLRIGTEYVDLTFLPEKEVLKPTSPERSMSIAQATPVRDNSLIFSTGGAACSATFSDSAKAASRTRLTSALKTLVRAEDSVTKGAVVDGDFWLLAASYEYAYALLLSREVIPSPSHLLHQLRTAAKGAPRGFERVSIGAGLESATRAG